MSVLVACASRHGATRGIAERIAPGLRDRGGQVTLRDAAEDQPATGYDAYMAGSSVYPGRWERTATAFVRHHPTLLASRPLWLFASGPLGNDRTDAWGRDLLHDAEPREFALFGAQRSERDFRDWADVEAWTDAIADQLAVSSGRTGGEGRRGRQPARAGRRLIVVGTRSRAARSRAGTTPCRCRQGRFRGRCASTSPDS